MRRGVEIPILDLTESQESYATGSNKVNFDMPKQPLPSAHLPDELLTTVHLCAMILTRPVHQMVVEETVNRDESVIGVGTAAERAFGHIAYKPLKDSLVGAIGCTAQVLMVAPTSPEVKALLKEGETAPMTVLCRGSYRFIVREVIKTIPFPVAIVDELIDDEPTIGPTSTEADEDVEDEDEDDDEEEDEDDVYADLTPSELVQRTLMAMKTHVDEQENILAREMFQPENILERDMTPLEQSIVQKPFTDYFDKKFQLRAAYDNSAAFRTFEASLPDIAPSPGQLYFTVAMMAAELSNLSNNSRRVFLQTTNGVERLRLVLGIMEVLVDMSQAWKMRSEITEETDEDTEETD
jgi:Lon protease-like protein